MVLLRSYQRQLLWGLAVLCALGLAAQLPAMRHLGYPLAVVTTAPACLFGLITARRPLAAWTGAIIAWVVFAIIVEPIWGCDTLSGIIWTILGPLTGACLGLAIGRCVQRFAGCTSWRYAVVCAVIIVIDLLALGWRLYDQPQVMVLDPFIGYIHGPIYDHWVPIEGPVIAGRLLILAVAAALTLLSARHSRQVLDYALMLFAVLGLSFDALPDRDDLQRVLSQTTKGQGVIVHAAPNQKRHVKRIVREAEAHIAHLCELTLGTPTPPVPVTIWLYPDASTKRALMGAGRVLIARPWQNEIHLHPTRRPDPHLRHELVHALLAHQSNNFLGVPLTPLPNPALIEGLAVFLGPGDSKLSVHQAAAALHRRGRLPSIDQLLGLRFSLAQGRTAYRAAGSLMKFIAEKHGFKRLLKAYHAGSLAAAGLDEDATTKAWISHLESTPEPPHTRRNLLRSYARTPLLKKACANEVEAAWRHAQRPGKRSDQAIEADYREVMALSGNCRPLGSLADRFHRQGQIKERRRIEDEMLQRGLPSTLAATLFERRVDEAIKQADWQTAKAHLQRALAAAPAEHRYRGLLVKALTLNHHDTIALIAPYLNSGAKAQAVHDGLVGAYPRLPTRAAAAVAYLLMRYYGNRSKRADMETWGLRAQPLPRTLAKETKRYLAQQAENHAKPCLAATRWRKLGTEQAAVADRLDEHLARIRFRYPTADCVVLASPKAP